MVKQRKTNADLEVAIADFSEVKLRNNPRIKEIITQTLSDVCAFYSYAQAIKSSKVGNAEKERLYGLMVNIKDKYRYPSLYNKLDEVRVDLRIK